MSSTLFEVQLEPDPVLRRLVLLAGVVAMLAGMVLIACVDWAAVWRGLAAIVWIAHCAKELSDQIRGASRVRQLRLDSDGGIYAVDKDGDRAAVILMTGSLILPRVAWLRLQFGDGRTYAEPLTRTRNDIEDWHKLQLLWQQARKAFGHTPGP